MPFYTFGKPSNAPADAASGQSWTPATVAAFALACALLVCLFNGDYLFSLNVGILDWPKELFYFHVLRGSLVEYGQLPVSFMTIPESISNFSTLQNGSFWANPEVVSLSPFMPLLFWFSTLEFIKLYFAGHFLLGIAGTGLLAKRLGFTPLQGVALFTLLALNPWLSQHLSIGYSPYINSLLFPALAALLLCPPRSPWQLALAALVNAMIFYQGALHLFVWFNLAALAVSLGACVHTRSVWPLGRVLWVQACTFALILPKFVATKAEYSDFTRYPGSGYASLEALWGLLTDSTSMLFDLPAAYTRYGVAFYDASLCVGRWFVALTGLAVLAALALRATQATCDSQAAQAGQSVQAIRERPLQRCPKAQGQAFPLWIAAMASAFFLALGWGDNWTAVTRLVPTLASEIYPFRWLYPAYMFAAVFTLGALSRVADGLWGRRLGAMVLVLALLPTALDLYERNAHFATLNATEQDAFGGFELREYLTHRVVGITGVTLLAGEPSPAGLTVIPPGAVGDPILLPWLEPQRLREFSFDFARPDVFQPESSTVLIVTEPSRPVTITANAHRRGILGMVGGGAFALLTLGAAVWCAKKNRRSLRNGG